MRKQKTRKLNNYAVFVLCSLPQREIDFMVFTLHILTENGPKIISESAETKFNDSLFKT